GGDRMQGSEVARMALAVEAVADRPQHQVGAAEAGGRRDGNDHPVLDERGGLSGGDELGHAISPSFGSMATARPDFADCSAASAAASDQTPSSPVADGAPSP